MIQVPIAIALASLGWLFALPVPIPQGCSGGYIPPTPIPPPLPQPPGASPLTPTAKPDLPNTGSPSTPSTAGPSIPSTPASGSTGTASTASWRTGPRTGLTLSSELTWTKWWGMNAFEYLRPLVRRAAVTLGSGADGFAPPDAKTPPEILADLSLWLADRDPAIRGAAALTAARLPGALTAERLAKLLGDPVGSVRESAVLAAGLAASEEFVPTLLRIAIEERTSPGAREESRVQEKDRAFALLSLGLGATRGLSARFAPVVRDFGERLPSGARRELGSAALAGFGLAAGEEALPALLRLSRDRQSPPPFRARALWAASLDRGPTLRPVAEALLEDGELDVRRAAALALGRGSRGGDDSLLEPLLRAVESEGDVAIRAFALIALGEGGGARARDELLRRATRGKTLLRPWAAIASGLALRRAPSAAGERALLEAMADERDPIGRSAFSLSLGLARTIEGRGELRERLASANDPEERMFAAIALALAEDRDAREGLRRAAASDTAPRARAAAALALSTFREIGDEAALVETFRRSKDPSSFATAALALAWHGSPACLETLRAATRGGWAPRERAVALLALGLALDASAVPESARLTAWWNFLAQEEAAHDALRLWS